jgi:hypothetical protein
MIGSRLALVRPRPTGALWWIAGAAAAALAGMAAREPALVMAALLPIAIGVSLLLSDERRFRARFLPDSLQVAPPPQTIAYRSILEVRPVVPLGAARPRAFAIEVVHERGSLLIPATLTVASERVYAFLRGYVPENAPRSLPATLDEYRREQETSFGADKVWSFSSRRGPFRHRGAPLRAAAKGVFATGALWLIVPFLRPEPGWFAAGAGAFVVGAVLLMLAADQGRGGIAVSRAVSKEAAMVITPLGLALQQGALSGHLTWQEIRKVSLRQKPTGFAAGHEPAPAIALEVEGATISITDSYDRPLGEIHDRIVKYWR